MFKNKILLSAVLTAGIVLSACTAVPEVAKAEGKPVGITGNMMKLEFSKDGKTHTIMRDQDNKATINPAFAKTSRPCPPFCIQPIKLAPGVETIGEREMIHFIKMMTSGEMMMDGSEILVVDSRTPDWVERGTIPGAINIPWTTLATKKGATIIDITEIMTEQFGVEEVEGLLNFGDAKTLVLFCNGMWCGQSPTNIKDLLKFGYPAHKIKWYRGGMQNWSTLGLSTM